MLALATAFRSFFLLAGLMAAMWMPVWMFVVFRGAQINTDLGLVGWHAHEMVFGYTGAVLAGFLLTATRAWTKRETLSGIPLALLVVLWCAGRAAALHSSRLPPMVAPAIDGTFFAVLAVALARPIILARSWRNLSFPMLLALIGACDVLVHLHVTGHVDPIWSARSILVALDALAAIILVFGGRIVPMFTGNAVGIAPRAKGWLDWLGLAAIGALIVLDLIDFTASATHLVAIAAGALNLARLWGWGGSRTARRPILWVLHLGWALLALGLILRGLSGFIPRIHPAATTHLFTIGGLGLLTLGMMARVSLGHTGRPLESGRWMSVAFVLLLAAIIARVLPGLLWPELYMDGVWVAGVAWSAAFAIFAVRYAPVLLGARVDGKPG